MTHHVERDPETIVQRMQRVIDEARRRNGPIGPDDIGVRKGELPTITELVSTPEERAAQARREERR